MEYKLTNKHCGILDSDQNAKVIQGQIFLKHCLEVNPISGMYPCINRLTGVHVA